MSLNKCMIIGNLGRDPEMRYTPSGQAVTQFTVATNRRWRDQQNEWQEETEWFRVVVWAERGEQAAEQLRKGHKVYVEGRLQTRQWEDQTGNKRYTTELIADRVGLERRDREDGHRPMASRVGRGRAPSEPASRPSSTAQDFDDLPFDRDPFHGLQAPRRPLQRPTPAQGLRTPSAPTSRVPSTTRRSTASAATSASAPRSSRGARRVRARSTNAWPWP